GHSVQACNWLKPSEAMVDSRGKKIITIKKEGANMQYAPKKKDNALHMVEVEKNQQPEFIGTHEGNKQNEEHEAERQQASLPCKDNGAILDATDGVVVQHSTSFSMTLNNVQDDIVLGDIEIDDPVMQEVTIDDVAGATVMNKDLDQEAEETYDNSSSVPETQLFVKQADAVEVENHFTPVNTAVSAANFDASARAIPDTTQKIVILPDEEFDEVVVDLKIIKQALVAQEKGEKHFTPLHVKKRR
ncbi:hypothetical protein L195_g037105, partial [Trifolium pratense]